MRQSPERSQVIPVPEVVPLTENEIDTLRAAITQYINLMDEQFRLALNLFADLEEKHRRYQQSCKSKGSIPVSEYEYIGEVEYMEDALHMKYMRAGSCVIELGRAVKEALAQTDPEIQIIEDHRIGEVFLAELFASSLNSNIIPHQERQSTTALIHRLDLFIDTQPSFREALKLSPQQKAHERFQDNTWWLMRRVRNDMTHLKDLPTRFALWAIGKHHFLELRSIIHAILRDDIKEDSYDPDQVQPWQELPDRGVLVNYARDNVADTIATLKHEARRKRGQQLKNQGRTTSQVFSGKK